VDYKSVQVERETVAKRRREETREVPFRLNKRLPIRNLNYEDKEERRKNSGFYCLLSSTTAYY
jgi:hypothetical protein